MRKLRIGLIGFGRFGYCHAEAIAASKYAELAAVASHTEKTCRKAHRRFGVPTTLDYRGLLKRADVDAVDIVLPTDLHARVAVDALRAGKHVFLEKPMALTTRQCDRILAEAERQGLTLSINFELRRSPLWGRIKADIRKGVVGRPLYGACDLWRSPFRSGADGWRLTQSRVGSWVHEEPVHFFDLAAWFFEDIGLPTQVTAHMIGRSGAPVEMSENMTCLLRWSGGQYFRVSQTNSFFGYHQQVRIAGEEGALAAIWEGSSDTEDDARHEYYIVKGGKHRRVPLRVKSNERLDLQRNVDQFCLRVFGRTSDIATGEDGRRAVALVEGSLRSARSGRPVKLR